MIKRPNMIVTKERIVANEIFYFQMYSDGLLIVALLERVTVSGMNGCLSPSRQTHLMVLTIQHGVVRKTFVRLISAPWR